MSFVFDTKRSGAAADASGYCHLFLFRDPDRHGAYRSRHRPAARPNDPVETAGVLDYNFDRARDTWVFTCQKPGLSFEIVAHDSPDARSAGIEDLDEGKQSYVAKNFFWVAIVKSEGNGPTDTALAAFR